MAQTFRALSVGELLDRTFFVYRRNFLLLCGIAALTELPSMVANLALTLLGLEPGVVYVLLLLATWVVAIVALTLGQGATVIAVSELQLGRRITIGEAFASIRPMLGSLFGTTLATGIIVGLGLLALIVPGLMLAVRYCFVIPVAVIEQRFGADARFRSSDLTDGRRWAIFWTYALLTLLVIIGTVIVILPTTIVAALASAAGLTSVIGVQVVTIVGNALSGALLTPVLMVGLTLMYYDQRVRKEAFDLEHMMAQIDQDTAPATA